MAESEEFLVQKLTSWKTGMEEKGLQVNVGKTKVMRCRVDAGQVVNSGKYPCGVCNKGVGSNSIQCTSYHAWIHRRCSRITGSMEHVSKFSCVKCMEGGNPVKSEGQHQISLGDGQNLDVLKSSATWAT